MACLGRQKTTSRKSEGLGEMVTVKSEGKGKVITHIQPLGEESHCYVIYDETDARNNHSLAFSDGIDKSQIKQLLRLVCRSKPNCETALKLGETSRQLDIKEGTLETLLVYLSLEGFVKLLPSGFASATICIVQDKSPVLETDECYQGALRMSDGSSGGGRQRTLSVELSPLAQQLG